MHRRLVASGPFVAGPWLSKPPFLLRCRAVVLLRRWLDEHAGGGPQYGEPGAGAPQACMQACLTCFL